MFIPHPAGSAQNEMILYYEVCHLIEVCKQND